MKRLITLFIIISTLCANAQVERKAVPVDFSRVKISDNFWQPRLKTHASVTLPSCLSYCTTKTARVNNFRIAAGMTEGKFQGMFFDDSDLYKMLEGIAYSLQNNANPQMEHEVDSIISIIAAAQQDDGYINTYYQVAHPDKKWTDMSMHEMYCGGHLIEAGIAYYNATGKRTLLNVGIGFANYLCHNFGPGKKDWVPGHQEIELALVKLYRITGDKRHLELAHFLLEERGQQKGQWTIQNPAYFMDEVPAKDVRKITGHAVRAMYQMTGMADYSVASSDTAYLGALQHAWKDLVETKMYITGGIGSSGHNEGFEEDFYLPNKEAYCETCASIGMIFWNHRMNSLFGNGKYLDIMEKCLYNGAMAGMSQSADLFFYVNPLSSEGKHHRQPWYGTACCPSNISRFVPSIGGYIYGEGNNSLTINTLIGSSTQVKVNDTKVAVSTQTNYPWEGNATITLNPEKACKFDLKIYIPGWCKKYSLRVNGKPLKAAAKDGFVTLSRKWRKDDRLELTLDMPVEVMSADPRVKADEGRRAIQRGPVIYCLEEVDNPDIANAVLSPDATYTPVYDPDFFGGATVIYSTDANGSPLKFIPYFLWDNRAAGKMDVWIPTTATSRP